MSRSYAFSLIAAAVTVAAFFIVWILLSTTSYTKSMVSPISVSTQGSDSLVSTFNTPPVVVGDCFASFEVPFNPVAGSWPGFRGPVGDNIASDSTPVADSWKQTGPSRLWSVALGEGHAAPAVDGGRVFVLDYSEEKHADMLRCFSLENGLELWRRWYRVELKRNHGLSRTMPAVASGFVVTFGPMGHAMCVSAKDGGLYWGKDIATEFKATIPLWYNGQCPIIDKSTAVFAPCGSALMVGIDCATAEIRWQTPNPRGWRMSHASITRSTLCGTPQYIYPSLDGVVGISADGDSLGKLLWESSQWSNPVIVPSAVVLPGDRVLLTAGYGKGSIVLKISRKDDLWKTSIDQRIAPTKGFSSEQQTPVFYKGYFYGILPNDAGVLRGQIACVSPDDISRIIWTSKTQARFGLGPLVIADSKIFILSDAGTLCMAQAIHTGYRELGRFALLTGRDAWAPIGIAGSRLLCRDDKTLVCLDIGKN